MGCRGGCSWAYDGKAAATDVERVGVACDDPNRLRCKVCDHRVVARCGTARPSVCVPCSTAYRGRVSLVAGSGYRHSPDRTYFLTLTAPGAVVHFMPNGDACPCTPVEGTDLARWNGGCGERWRKFSIYLRRLYGEFVYFKATEVQRRGALHVHVIMRMPAGFPPPALSVIRRLAIAQGFGHAVKLLGVRADHATYLAKYVAKSADSRADVPWSGTKRQQGRPVVTAHGEFLGYVYPNGDLEDVARRHRASFSPSYRTWSASRRWGESMMAVRAAQSHFNAVVAALPADGLWPADCAGRVPRRPDLALARLPDPFE